MSWRQQSINSSSEKDLNLRLAYRPRRKDRRPNVQASCCMLMNTYSEELESDEEIWAHVQRLHREC